MGREETTGRRLMRRPLLWTAGFTPSGALTLQNRLQSCPIEG